MAQHNIQKPGLAGAVVTFAAANAGGDLFSNDGHTSLRIKNGGGAPITVTVLAQTPCNQGATHDDVVSVAAGAEKNVGPFSSGRFNDSTGNVHVTYSAVASVTIAAVAD